MNRKLILSGILFLICSASALYAQQSTVYHQMWEQLPDDPNKHTEVAYAVVDCNGAPTVLLNIFNESASSQSVSFDLEMASGTSTATHTVTNLNLNTGDMKIGECSSTEAYLKFEVPAGLDPKTVTFNITYN